MVATDDIFDTDEIIPVGMATAMSVCGKIDSNCGRCRVVDGVATCAAVVGVFATPALNDIVAVQAPDRVGQVVAFQGVGMPGSNQVGDVREGVLFRSACCQAGGDAIWLVFVGAFVGNRIDRDPLCQHPDEFVFDVQGVVMDIALIDEVVLQG